MSHSRFPVGKIDFDRERTIRVHGPSGGKVGNKVQGSRGWCKDHVTDKGGAMSWYAVYTKSRHERTVNTHLVQEGITVFLPEIERLSSRKDRRKKAWYPIFPGYLFINTELNAESRLRVIKTKGVVRILGHRGIAAAIPEHQIELIQKAIDSRKNISSFPYLKRGQVVRVMNGPLDGMEGIFVSEKGKGKLIISVDILQRSVAVEIEETDVEPIQSLSLCRP